MTLDQLKNAVEDYFSDCSRSKKETGDGLRAVADLANKFAEEIDPHGWYKQQGYENS